MIHVCAVSVARTVLADDRVSKPADVVIGDVVLRDTVAAPAGFPVFPPGTSSLLCKYLTHDLFVELRDKVTPSG